MTPCPPHASQYIEAKFAAERSAGEVTEDTHFMYAWALIRSRYRDDRLLGIQELESRDARDAVLLKLMDAGIMEKYPSRRRECVFYLASANYKIGEFKTALRHVNELAAAEPHNQQVAALKEKIEKKLTNGEDSHASVTWLITVRWNHWACLGRRTGRRHDWRADCHVSLEKVTMSPSLFIFAYERLRRKCSDTRRARALIPIFMSLISLSTSCKKVTIKSAIFSFKKTARCWFVTRKLTS